ncbi:hypothetical protein NDU88_007240 [Pleurodeles waltl]|uniref:Uncharacterized protein n=1 Tax=Pleurodeles waltl TaxID=8319 RepID=A0AAV7RUG5_PLEWA|nr:hypothetical protein NDU88_007240 [Pleurodeles waltl]
MTEGSSSYLRQIYDLERDMQAIRAENSQLTSNILTHFITCYVLRATLEKEEEEEGSRAAGHGGGSTGQAENCAESQKPGLRSGPGQL